MTAFATRNDVLSWGRVHRTPQRVATPQFLSDLPPLLAPAPDGGVLACGLRRSYGDTCLNSGGALIDMRGLGRFIAFDPQTGVLRTQAGLAFTDMLRLVVPHGWFAATTPGTRFVTLGGAVANDVHGKNHHCAGSFGRHVRAIGLLRSDSGRRTVRPESDPALFASTVGGLGLTGIIEWVEIQLVRIGGACLDVEIVPYGSLDEFWALADESSAFEHTVAWIDCVTRGANQGRGIFSRANWIADGVYDAHDDRTWKRLPTEAPGFALNRFTVRAFNELYHRANAAKAGRSRQHYATFFYPLDSLLDWNKMYGRKGMIQYQCVVPPADRKHTIAALLDVVAQSGAASFLAVLKTFGDLPSPGVLSFPRRGATLALDFPFHGDATRNICARLDDIVREAGGALYPAKDGRMSADMFRRSFPQWESLLKDPAMHSDFWRRVTQ